MKIAIECKTESTTRIPGILTVSNNDYEYSIYPGKDGFAEKIRIVKSVPKDRKVDSRVEHGSSGSPSKLIFDYDQTTHSEIIKEFQRVESALVLNGMKQVYWTEGKVELIPENDNEKEQVQVFSLEIERGYPKRIESLDQPSFAKIIQNIEKYDNLIVLNAFLREGQREFERFRYIQAFYNFYFILEGIYGGGKTNNDQVEDNFKASQELVDDLKNNLKNHIENSPKHKENLEMLLKERQLEYSVDSIIKLIVKTRGSLHHYSERNTLRQGTPLNQQDYETISFLVLSLALMGILRRTLISNNSGNNV